MRRLWAAAIILVILLALCTWGLSTTMSLSDELNHTLQEAYTAAEEGNLVRAQELSNEAQTHWKKFHRILSTYIQHTRLEEIDRSLATLSPLLQHGAVDAFSSECARTAAQIASLREAEMPILENIL